MKFGLKLWSRNSDLIGEAIHLIDRKIFDYIELFVVPGTSIDPFKVDVPFIIHIPHQEFGVNIGDGSKKKYNLQKIRESISWADKLDAEYLILHAGDGSMQDAKDLLREITDTRMLIENMPKVGLNGEKMIGFSNDQINELIGNSDMGLCLDFGHAVKASLSLGLEYKEYIRGFLRLKPKVFHMTDGRLSKKMDEHLNIGEGDYDFGYFLDCVRKNKSRLMTVETPRSNSRSLQEDVRNVELLKIY